MRLVFAHLFETLLVSFLFLLLSLFVTMCVVNALIKGEIEDMCASEDCVSLLNDE